MAIGKTRRADPHIQLQAILDGVIDKFNPQFDQMVVRLVNNEHLEPTPINCNVMVPEVTPPDKHNVQYLIIELPTIELLEYCERAQQQSLVDLAYRCSGWQNINFTVEYNLNLEGRTQQLTAIELEFVPL